MSGWVIDWASRLGDVLTWLSPAIGVVLLVFWALLHRWVAFRSWDAPRSGEFAGIEVFDDR